MEYMQCVCVCVRVCFHAVPEPQRKKKGAIITERERKRTA